MTTWAVIPAKPLAMAKTRLAPALTPAARAALARALFRRTVSAARACPALSGVVVVSAGAELRALAVDLGAYAYADPPMPDTVCGFYANGAYDCPPQRAWGRTVAGLDPSGSVPCHALSSAGFSGGEGSLNRAVALGCRRAAALGADAALVLPADLPLITPEAIARFLGMVGDATVGVAPNRAETGTNALLLRPPSALAPSFGPDSFARHRALAEAGGLSVATVRIPELALDLDTPADLAPRHGYTITDVDVAHA